MFTILALASLGASVSEDEMRRLSAFELAAQHEGPRNNENCVCVSPGESNEMECCTEDGDCEITYCPMVDTLCFSVENGSDECRDIDESLIVNEKPDDESVEFDDDSVEDSTSKDVGLRRIEDRLGEHFFRRRSQCSNFNSCVDYSRCPANMNRHTMESRFAQTENNWRGQCVYHGDISRQPSGASIHSDTLKYMRANGIYLRNGATEANSWRNQKRHCRSDEICWSGAREWFGDGTWPATAPGCGWERMCRKRRCWCQHPGWGAPWNKIICESGSSTGTWNTQKQRFDEHTHAWCHHTLRCTAHGFQNYPVGGFSRGNWNHMCKP